MVPPLVAAGANLSFWPLGFFFRRGGAFFLRRTFKGDRAVRGGLPRLRAQAAARVVQRRVLHRGRALAHRQAAGAQAGPARHGRRGRARRRRRPRAPSAGGADLHRLREGDRGEVVRQGGGRRREEEGGRQGPAQGHARPRRAVRAAQHSVRRSAAARRDAARVRRHGRVGRRGQRGRARRRGAVEGGDAAPGASHRLRHRPRHRGDADGAGRRGAPRPPASAASCAASCSRTRAFLIERARRQWRAAVGGARRRRRTASSTSNALDRASSCSRATAISRCAPAAARARSTSRAGGRSTRSTRCPKIAGRGSPTIATTRSISTSPTAWWRWRCSARPSTGSSASTSCGRARCGCRAC